MSSIGDRIREERERLELNQTQLADLLGTTRKTQFNYETDARRPDANYLAAMASAGANVQYILTGDLGPRPEVVLSAEEKVLLEYFRDASKEVRRAALGALIGGPMQGTVRQVIHGHVSGSVAGRDIVKGAGKR